MISSEQKEESCCCFKTDQGEQQVAIPSLAHAKDFKIIIVFISLLYFIVLSGLNKYGKFPFLTL